MKSVPKKPNIIFNNISDQNKTGANSLTIQEWNSVVNILKTQANLNTRYIENLHRVLVYDWSPETLGSIEVPELGMLTELYKAYNIMKNIVDDRAFSSTWYMGAEITGEGSTINAAINVFERPPRVNDVYLNTTTSNIYRCIESGMSNTVWSYEGNSRGISLRARGVWTENKTYYSSEGFLDIVSYNGQSYLCKLKVINGEQNPETDTTHWQLLASRGASFNIRGEWSSLEDYVADNTHIDVVLYLGDAYYCKETIQGDVSNSNPLADPAHWGAYVEKGISFRYRGAWEANAGYHCDNDWIDIVRHRGVLYICLNSHSNRDDEPQSDFAYWDVFIDNRMYYDSFHTNNPVAHTLQDNEDKTFTGSIATIEVTIPATIAHGFHAGVNYLSRSLGTLLEFVNLSNKPLHVISVLQHGSLAYHTASGGMVNTIIYCDGVNVYCHISEVVANE